jgi:cation diffusion facilitator family transporter
MKGFQLFMGQIFDRSKVAKKATLIGMVVNIVLLTLKVLIGLVGNSAALISDAAHTFSDFIGDIIVFIGYRFTSKPADAKHNYGLGKVETIVSVIIAMILFYIGYQLIRNSIKIVYQFYIHDVPIKIPRLISLIPVAISIIAKETMYHYSIRIAKKIDSDTMRANAWHQRSDALSSIAALIGIGIAIIFGKQFAIFDPIASFVVSLLILKVGYGIIKSSFQELLDVSLTDEEVQKIRNIIISMEQISSYGNIRTRKIGYYISVDVHIHVDPQLNVVEAHDISSKLEDKLYLEFGDETFISIHIEPNEK